MSMKIMSMQRQLLYELKYQKNKQKAGEILHLIKPFLNQWRIGSKIDFIIPAPPSTRREVQPVFEICTEISKYLNKRVVYGVIEKTTNIQSKDLSLENKSEISGSFLMKKNPSRTMSLL